MSGSRFRVAVLGCGRIADKHIEALTALDGDIEIVGLCDADLERASAAATKVGGRPYTDYEQMLDAEKPDWVSICTPSGMHPEQGILAAKKGAHVVTEKPIGTQLAPVDAMIDACRTNEVELFCVKQVRLMASMQLLKRAIDKGRFGKIYLAQTNVFWQRPQEYYDASKWRGTKGLDGGALLNQASHYVDALHWLMGGVDSVMAYTATMGRAIEMEDTACAALRFANGAIGTVNVTMLTYPKNLEGSVIVLGEKGSVKIGGAGANRIDTWHFEDYDDDDKIVEDTGGASPATHGSGHRAYYEHVLDVLGNRGQTPDIDGAEARRSLEVILAIYRSAETGQRVTLPLA